MKRPLVLLVVFAAALSGCTSGAPATPRGATDAPRIHDALHGWIFDPALEPVVGANVTIHGTNASIRTDAQGLYRFPSAPRATPIVVIVEAPAFLTASRGVTVPEDAGLVLNFTLEPVPVKQPRKTVVPLPGFLSCQFFLVVDQDEEKLECGSFDSTNNRPQRDFSMEPDVAGMVLELDWEPGTPLAETLNITVETVNLGDQDRVLASAVGAAPLKAQVGEQAARRFYTNGGIARFTVSAGAEPDEDEASIGTSFAFQQAFTVHLSVFYVNPPAPTYTALKD